MNRSLLISSVLHAIFIMITALSLPFLAKKPIDLPPIVSIELIQITDKTNIPFAPKAKKTIEKIKEKEKKLVSEQAPPKKVKKIKPDSVPMPEDKVKILLATPPAPPPAAHTEYPAASFRPAPPPPPAPITVTIALQSKLQAHVVVETHTSSFITD